MKAAEYDDLGKYIDYRLKRFFIEENRIRAKHSLEFWTSASLNDKHKKIFDQRYAEFQKDITTIIEKGQEHGIYSKRIPLKTFTHILMSSLDGISMMDTVLNQPITEEIIETTIKIFIGYLKEVK